MPDVWDDASMRESIRKRYGHLWRPPSAVDRLAALADPDGESAELVRRWEKTKERLTLIRPEFYKTVTVENL